MKGMIATALLPLLMIPLLLSIACPAPEPCPECPPPIECETCEVCAVCPEPEACPGPIECVDTLECPDGYTLEKYELRWVCTPPVPDVQPSDYISTSRANRIIYDVEVESRSAIWLSSWSGVRHERHAATYCNPFTEEVLNKSSDELFAFANNGEALLFQWNNKWRRNLATPNKRCEEHTEFCVVSNVRKSNWSPYVEQLRIHRAAANLHIEQVLADPKANCAYDNVQGWCQCRNGLLPPR